RPNLSRARAIIVLTSASTVTSVRMKLATGPSVSASRSPLSRRRPAMTTRAPSATNSVAILSPMPTGGASHDGNLVRQHPAHARFSFRLRLLARLGVSGRIGPSGQPCSRYRCRHSAAAARVIRRVVLGQLLELVVAANAAASVEDQQV